MRYLYVIAALLLFGSATLQWLGIGERIYHALLMWLKFGDTNGDGHTTVSFTMAAATYLLSFLLIASGIFLAKCQGGKFVNLMGKISTLSLASGVVGLSFLILSPFGELVAR